MIRTRILVLSLFFSFRLIIAQTIALPAELINSFNLEELAPTWVKYTINPAIRDSLRKHISKVNSRYQAVTLKDTKVTRKKTKADFSSYISYQHSDTINIILIPRTPVNTGFRLLIKGDSCAVFLYSFEGDPPTGIFKLRKSDPVYTSSILVPAKLTHVTLLEKPGFTSGETISGYIEFECQPYRIRWDTYYDEEERSYMEGYFSTTDAP